jgi:hypothetical protein
MTVVVLVTVGASVTKMAVKVPHLSPCSKLIFTDSM